MTEEKEKDAHIVVPEVEEKVNKLISQYKEYSVSEFFKKNRQMLGYSGKVRSLTTIVHEYVTNSLDACEDARILPEILIEIHKLPNGHIKVVSEDNGIGIPKEKVGQALGMLLAGTKFHVLRQKRGQQGIGAAYATLFAQITTGKPIHIKTSIGRKLFECDLSIDVKKNAPVIKNEKEYSDHFRGVKIEAEFANVEYNEGEHSVYEYLRRTALATPHAQITLVKPDNSIVVFPRSSNYIPSLPPQVKPHPLGVTVSDLMDMASASGARKISSFLVNDFSRASSVRVKEIQKICPNIDLNRAPSTLTWAEAEELVKAFHSIKWIAPDMDTLQPIGKENLTKSLKALLQPDELAVVERKPRVFMGGIPFLVEAAIAYGGKAGNQRKGGAEIMRFANKVPLLFDAGNCAITASIKSIDWGRYGLKNFEEQPMTVFVNFVSVHVPYTGAGKLAISAEAEIVEEIRLAVMECARKISLYLSGLRKMAEKTRRKNIFFKYITEVSESLHRITGRPAVEISEKLRKLAEERTGLLEAEALEESTTQKKKKIGSRG